MDRSYFVVQAGLKLIAVFRPQPPKYWDYRRESPHLAVPPHLASLLNPGSSPASPNTAACLKLLHMPTPTYGGPTATMRKSVIILQYRSLALMELPPGSLSFLSRLSLLPSLLPSISVTAHNLSGRRSFQSLGVGTRMPVACRELQSRLFGRVCGRFQRCLCCC